MRLTNVHRCMLRQEAQVDLERLRRASLPWSDHSNGIDGISVRQEAGFFRRQGPVVHPHITKKTVKPAIGPIAGTKEERLRGLEILVQLVEQGGEPGGPAIEVNLHA